MERKISVFEAKSRFSGLLDEVAAGGQVVITKHGRPVAKLVPAPRAADREQAQAAVERIFERSRGLTLGDTAIGKPVDDGCR